MKPQDIYNIGDLNTERIATYKKLAIGYNLSEGTVRDIFCKGAEWGIEVSNRNTTDDIPTDESTDKCRFYDHAQGRHKCTNPKFTYDRCRGVCDKYEERSI